MFRWFRQLGCRRGLHWYKTARPSGGWPSPPQGTSQHPSHPLVCSSGYTWLQGACKDSTPHPATPPGINWPWGRGGGPCRSHAPWPRATTSNCKNSPSKVTVAAVAAAASAQHSIPVRKHPVALCCQLQAAACGPEAIIPCTTCTCHSLPARLEACTPPGCRTLDKACRCNPTATATAATASQVVQFNHHTCLLLSLTASATVLLRRQWLWLGAQHLHAPSIAASLAVTPPSVNPLL